MSRLRSVATALSLLLSVAACGSEGASLDHAPLSVTVAHVNDTHAHLDPTESALSITPSGESPFDFNARLGGYPALKGKLSALRSRANEEGRHFLALHGGDAFQGSLYFVKFRGEEEARLLSEMQLDAMAIGNHEFDLGNEPLRNFASKVNFPILAANLDRGSSAVLASETRIVDHVIKEFEGERIGIFGLVLEDMPNISAPDAGTVFLPQIETAKRTVAALEAQGVNKIVMVSHIGLQGDQAVARAVDGIDLIVGGHSHSLLGDVAEFESIGYQDHMQQPSDDNRYAQLVATPNGGSTCIVQAGQFAAGYGLVDVSLDREGVLASCAGRNTLMTLDDFTRTETDPASPDKVLKVPLSEKDQARAVSLVDAAPAIEVVTEDAALRAILDAEFRPAVAELESEVIADVPKELPHVRVPKGPDGAGVIDALVAESVYATLASNGTPVDFSIINAGGVRSSVSAGSLTAGFVLGTLLPFEQAIVSLNLRGEDVRRTLEGAVDLATANGTGKPASSGSFPYVGHLAYTYDGKKAKGARIVKLERRLSDGSWSAIVDGDVYRIGTLQYLSLGKDGYAGMLARSMLPNEGDFVDSTIQINLGFIEYAKAQKTLLPLPYTTVVYLAP